MLDLRDNLLGSAEMLMALRRDLALVELDVRGNAVCGEGSERDTSSSEPPSYSYGLVRNSCVGGWTNLAWRSMLYDVVHKWKSLEYINGVPVEDIPEPTVAEIVSQTVARAAETAAGDAQQDEDDDFELTAEQIAALKVHARASARAHAHTHTHLSLACVLT